MRLLALTVVPVFVGALLLLFLNPGPPIYANTALQNPPTLPSGATASNSVWWVGASSNDASALPNTGVRGTISVADISVANGDVLDFWVADELSNSNWGQVGYYIMGGGLPVAFYEIWNLNTNTVLTTVTTSVSTGTHTFSMYLQSGTTWAFALDGKVFGTYNMGASSSSASYPVFALAEEQAPSVFSFPSVTFSSAMQVLKSGTWSNVATAASYGTAWGVQGQVQNPSLASDEITVGTSVSSLPSGTSLWGVPSSSTTSTTSYPNPTSTVTTTVTSTKTVTSTVTATSVSSSTVTVTSPTTTTSTSTATRTVTTTSTSTLTSPTTTTQTVTTTVTSPTTTTDTKTVTSTSTATQTVTSTSTKTSTATSTVTSPTTVTSTQTATSTSTETVTSPTTYTTTTTSTSPSTTTVTTTAGSGSQGTSTETATDTVTVTQTVYSTSTVTQTVASPTTIYQPTTVTQTSVSTATPSTVTTTVTEYQTSTVTVTGSPSHGNSSAANSKGPTSAVGNDSPGANPIGSLSSPPEYLGMALVLGVGIVFIVKKALPGDRE